MNSSMKFLNNDITRSILRDVITPDGAPHTLLRIFTGARKAEAERCFWSHLFSKRDAAILATSCGSRRLVPICRALSAWIEPYFGLDGRMDPHGSADRRFRVKLSRLNIELPASVFRKNYTFNRLVVGVQRMQVLRELGYNAPLPLFDSAVCKPISEAQGEEFFRLTPEACGRPQWPQEVAAWRSQIKRS
jgi:hypothetical protein